MKIALRALVLLGFAATMQAGGSMARLVSVTDGNAMVVSLRGADVKLRMHGIVVPPADEERPILAQLNRESVAFLKKYLESDGWLYLEFPEGTAKPDAEGFVSAFVYHGKDATFLNEKLIAEGLAIVNNKEKNAFTAKLTTLQNNAKGAQRGIWGSFAGGGGAQIASGKVARPTYIGVPGVQERRDTYSSYVRYWIHYYE
jgi:endonuclease YncB( thermonuclease family)